jgi:hypothetical protein
VSFDDTWDDGPARGTSRDAHDATTDRGSFVGAETRDEPAGAVRQPVAWLWAAVGVLLLSVALRVLDVLALSTIVVNVVGYLLAPVVVIVLVSAFRFKDQRLAMEPQYSPRIDLPIAGIETVTLLLSILVGAWHIWPIATELAR